MKKQLIYSITVILLLVISVTSVTYSFLSASTGQNNNVSTNSSRFQIIYTGGTEINGPLDLSADRSGGVNTTVHIKVAQGSSQALSYLYFNIEQMTANLSSSNVKWEVVGTRNSQQVYTNSGTFSGYNSTTNNKIPLVENYRLTEDQTDFTVYIWIDGNSAGNEMFGASLSGYISANTEQFTGVLTAAQ